MKKNIVIIDYGLCNLLSVFNALRYLGVASVVSHDPASLKEADAVILPGVGAFADGMQGLENKNFIPAIHAYVKTGKPFLGICLGMQMLMDKSYEFGEHQGLNLVEGEVVSFKNRFVDGKYDFKVPHIGWEGLCSHQVPWQGTILRELKQGEFMYFVHSFFPVPKDEKHVLAKTSYAGIDFCSVIARENVYGCQFHPEKSAQHGLKILKNFVELTS
ncbi:MAG: imidazole glycerol phosphate synthase subunit HisH [Candidatus Omnitrophota bacterium]|jgi:glutamine amidotransferase|nr:imidazole glycerol phosphate synthase subunit HisH [Candidatus Omnitrophota bacterium]